MKILELFSGYGTASFALKQLGIPYELVGYSDIDKYANQCFRQNHCPVDMDRELGDCTKIDPNDLDDFDLLTGGFPCQAFSVAGKGLGELDTRGTLFNEIIRIAAVKKPRYMMLENVKGLMSKRHKPTFDKIISELYRIGYFVKWKVLNTKEHGIPQNRDRIFFICCKNWNDFCSYEWPEKEELSLLLKDILEESVDEKYYLSEERIEKLMATVKDKELTFGGINVTRKGELFEGNTDIAGTLMARDYKGLGNQKMTVACVPVLTPDRLEKRQNGRRFKTDGEPMFTLNTQDRHGILQINNPRHSQQRVYSPEGISPTISAGNKGGGKEPCKILQVNPGARNGYRVYSPEGISPTICSNGGGTTQDRAILIKNATKKGYLLAFPGDGINLEQPNSKTRRGRVQPQMSPTLQCNDARGVLLYDLTIRKLTPTECFRLQGFLNDEVNLEGLSNTQRYKLAGNGQSVNVVKKIFGSLFLKTEEQ